jgi:protease I
LNTRFDEVNPESYDALVVPGGPVHEDFRLNEKVLNRTYPKTLLLGKGGRRN